MKPFLIIIPVSIAAGIIGLAWLTDAQNGRILANAQAQAITTQANAQATAITLAAVVPLTIVAIGGLIGLILAVGVVILLIRRPAERVHSQPVIERQIIYVLPAGSYRRELWQTLSDTRPVSIGELRDVQKTRILR